MRRVSFNLWVWSLSFFYALIASPNIFAAKSCQDILTKVRESKERKERRRVKEAPQKDCYLDRGFSSEEMENIKNIRYFLADLIYTPYHKSEDPRIEKERAIKSKRGVFSKHKSLVLGK